MLFVKFSLHSIHTSQHEITVRYTICTVLTVKYMGIRFSPNFIIDCLQPISTTPNKGQIHPNTQSEVDANFKSHYYTTAKNLLKLIFGQGCQTKLASNPSVLPQTRVKYTQTPNLSLTPTSKVTFTQQQQTSTNSFLGRGAKPNWPPTH